jgi:acetolactate synthase-1/3 small subunit
VSSPYRHHILSVLVENKPGVLARVAGLFARRGYNIFSLAVAPTEDERFSRLTIVVDVESDPRESVERELLLVTVSAVPDIRGQIIELVQVFGGRILAVGHDALTISIEGAPEKIDDVEELLRPYGIVELQRTGRIALPRLERTPRARIAKVS